MGRFGFVLKRLLLAVPMFLAVILVVFLLLDLAPGDPARQVAGLRAPEQQVERVRESLGLNDPIYTRYWRYVKEVFTGDLGHSFKSQQSVSSMIGERIEPTAWLLGFGTLLALLFSVPLAFLAALRHDRVADHAVRTGSAVALGMPAFWVGVMLILLVALPTGLFPVGGFGGSFGQKLQSIALPALTLAIGSAPVLIRSLRASVLGILESDYVTTARSLGLSQGTVLRKFVIRNAAAPTVTILALEVGFLLFGAVVIESTFAIHGLGEGIVVATHSRDPGLIQGYTLLFAVIVIVVYLINDVILALLDPRVSIES